MSIATVPRRSILAGALAGLLSPLLMPRGSASARPPRPRPAPPRTRVLMQFGGTAAPRYDLDPTIPSLNYVLTSLDTHQSYGDTFPLTGAPTAMHTSMIAHAIAVMAEVEGLVIAEDEVLILGGPCEGMHPL